MIIAKLCIDCKTVFEYTIKDHWERIKCECCGSKDVSLRTIPEDRKDLVDRFYKEA